MIQARALLLATALLPASALAQQIVLYEHSDFRGNSRTFTRETPNLVDAGFNDRASSLRVLSGAWEVCEHAGFGGRCQVLEGTVSNLQDSGWNDRISSIRPAGRRLEHESDRYDRDGDRRDDGRRDGRREERWDGRRGGGGGRRMRPEITVYTSTGFRGESRTYDGFVENLEDERFNDRIASLRVGSGVWEGCEHANFRGRCAVFEADEWDLGYRQLDRRISSLRPLEDEHVDTRDEAPVIILYEHAEFRGESRRIGRGSVRDLAEIGFDDRVSSVRVKDGVWELCQSSSFRGRCIVLEGDEVNLSDRGLNDQASSLRRLDRR